MQTMGSAITNNDSDQLLQAFFHNPFASLGLSALPYSGMQAKGNEHNCQARELADVLGGILDVQTHESCHLHDHFPHATPSTAGESGVFSSPLSMLPHEYAKHASVLEINNHENILLQDPFIDAEAASLILQPASDQLGGSNSEHLPLILDHFGAMPAFGLAVRSMDEIRSCSYSACSMQQCDDQRLEPVINQINAAKEGSMNDFDKVSRGGEILMVGDPCMALQGVDIIGGANAACCTSARRSTSASDGESNASGSSHGNLEAKVSNGNATCSGSGSGSGDLGVLKEVQLQQYIANHHGSIACNGDNYGGKNVNYAENDDDDDDDDKNNDSTWWGGADYYRASMREVVYAAAALQPLDWESIMEATAGSRPKRRNVRISKDPQSVSARRRRERIGDRIRVLQRLVPGGTKMDTASMLDEAIHYLKFLKSQVQALQWIERSSSSSSLSPYNFPTFTTLPPIRPDF